MHLSANWLEPSNISEVITADSGFERLLSTFPTFLIIHTRPNPIVILGLVHVCIRCEFSVTSVLDKQLDLVCYRELPGK